MLPQGLPLAAPVLPQGLPLAAPVLPQGLPPANDRLFPNDRLLAKTDYSAAQWGQGARRVCETCLRLRECFRCKELKEQAEYAPREWEKRGKKAHM